ncbi:hypothetical protein [Bacillus cereus]|uniref:hypothetical protein n=1 Tax=Bacillus cereus TaxID=1396 RepID=UPI00158A6854|nr:hypothetical protein [Bacillus cereus]
MFKKGIVSFLLFILIASSFNGITSAETTTSEYVGKQFYAYDQPSFTSKKANAGAILNP